MALILREIMAQRNISQRDLEQLSGVTQAYICKILKGKQDPSLYILEKLAKGLDIDVRELFDGGKTITCPCCGKKIELDVQTRIKVKQ